MQVDVDVDVECFNPKTRSFAAIDRRFPNKSEKEHSHNEFKILGA